MPFFRSIFLCLLLLPGIQNGLTAQETGVQLYTFREQLKQDLRGTLVKIKEMGIKELEGGGTYGLSREEWKQLLDSLGFRMISWGADFGQLEKDPAALVAEAKYFGAKYLTCFWIPHQEAFGQADLEKAITVFNRAGKILADQGLILTYHPHGYEFGIRPGQTGKLPFDELVSRTDPRYLSFEMDVFWVRHPGQDPVALLKKYPSRFKMLHLKDRLKGTPDGVKGEADVETNVVLGTGDVGIAEVMKTARRLKIAHYFIEDESSRSMEQVPRSLAFLRGLN